MDDRPDVDRPEAAEGRYFHDMCAGNYDEALKHVEPDRTGPASSSTTWPSPVSKRRPGWGAFARSMMRSCIGELMSSTSG